MKLEKAIFKKLSSSNAVLCSVESCTGGLIAHSITNIDGASKVFWGGLVVYDNSAKIELGVPSAMIEKYGAVSRQVAGALAQHGLRRMKKALNAKHASTSLRNKIGGRKWMCISTTGIAGPQGGTSRKPVGLCYIGLASSSNITLVEKCLVNPNESRTKIKNIFAQTALRLILKNS